MKRKAGGEMKSYGGMKFRKRENPEETLKKSDSVHQGNYPDRTETGSQDHGHSDPFR